MTKKRSPMAPSKLTAKEAHAAKGLFWKAVFYVLKLISRGA